VSDEAEVQRKVRKTAQLLLLPRPRSPGVKGWELKRTLGKDYMKILELAKEELSRLDLEVKIVSDEADAPDDYDRARFFVVLKHPPPLSELVSAGWRIDDLAVLAATLTYIVSRHGKVPRKDVEQLLKEKFPRWKVDLNLDRFTRLGYLSEGEEVLTIGWRTRAEIDQKTLMNLLLSSTTSQEPRAK